jgi:uncharacterized protein YigA (DUF484 family)
MTDSTYSAQDIADFLAAHPDFFVAHADVFATLRVPNPHGAQVISLAECQILTLRERHRELEWQLSALIHNARQNQRIADALTGWSRRLLAEAHPTLIPGAIALGLAETFELPATALRVWGLPGIPETGYGEPVTDDIRTFANSLKQPYCGTNTEFEAAAWLPAKPTSLALVALRLVPDGPSCGLLVLGSDDAARFDAAQGVAFLETIGSLAQAALARLQAPAPVVLPDTAG